jgi:cytochrome c556
MEFEGTAMLRTILRITVAFGVATALSACSTTQPPPENPQAVVNQRVAVMKGFAGALGAAGNFAQGKGSAEAAKAKIAAARKGAERLEDLFPPGTALGDRGVSDSRALSTIFTNRRDFDAKRAALEEALAALEGALAKKSNGETGKLVTSAKSTCAACHSRYRTPDES